MSQSTLLTEAELPEQIHTYLEIRFEKDAFLKPTREVVSEIYSRFLIKFGVDCKPKNVDTSPLAIMYYWLKRIFSNYSIDYEFNLGDILAPARKRTTTFVNVILYILADFDDAWRERRHLKVRAAERESGLTQLSSRIEENKVILEKLAWQKGNSPTVEQLKSEDVQLQANLEKLQSISAALNQTKDEIKKRSEEHKVSKHHRLRELEDVKSQLFALDEQKRLEMEHSNSQEELEILDRNDGALKLQLATHRQEASRRIICIKEKLGELDQQHKAWEASLNSEDDEIRREGEAILRKREGLKRDVTAELERAKKRLADLKNHCNESKKKLLPNLKTMLNNRTKVTTIAYGPVVADEEPRDRTFIKMSQH